MGLAELRRGELFFGQGQDKEGIWASWWLDMILILTLASPLDRAKLRL
jgi:hypothetical protein